MLSVKGLTYTKENDYILSDVNMELPLQKIIGLLGPNAAGKTTLMQLLTGLRYLQNGEIELDTYNERLYLLENTIYMSNEQHFPASWTGEQLVKHYQLACKRFNYQKFMGMIKQLNVDLTKQLKRLSRGTKERLMISLTLAQDAKYYFLDEPLTGVDMLTREEIIRSMLTFVDEEATIVLSSHYIEVFEMLLEEVYFINNGKIIGHVDCETMRAEHGLTLNEYYIKEYKGGVSVW